MSQKYKVWLGVGMVIGLLMMGKTIGNIIRLYKAGGRVRQAQDQILALKAEKVEMEKKASESGTVDFVERQVREKLGLGKPGEIVVVIPDDNPMSQKSNNPVVDKNVPNWKLWRKLYLGF